MTKRRKKYSKEFKLEAVKMVIEQGRSAAEVARSLGLNDNLLHLWKQKAIKDGDLAFPGNGRRNDVEEELRQLRRELAQVKQDREILKKAAAYFAQNQD